MSPRNALSLFATVVALAIAVPQVHADELFSSRGYALVEVSHDVAVDVGDGFATYTVTRSFRHSGERADQAVVFVDLPPGAVATGLRIRASNRWYDGELMAASIAEQRYEELTGLGIARPMDPALLMLRVVEALPKNEVVVDEGILSTRALHGFLPFRDTRGFFGLASGGIGFALPGAIGIQLAQPERPVVAIVGDGSAMYSIQALWTAAHLKLPITYVICNNASYRIIKERLRAFHGSAYAGTAGTGHHPRSDRRLH